MVDEISLLGEEGEFEIGRALSEAWTATWSFFGAWLGVFLVGGLLILVSVFIPPGLGTILIGPVLIWGMTLFVLGTIDGSAQFSDLFAGFSHYGRALISMLVFWLLTTIVSLVGQLIYLLGVVIEEPITASVGYVLALIWNAVVAARLYFAGFFIVDRDLGPVEAMQTSWDITQGQVLRVAGLSAISILVTLVGMLALLIGIIPAMFIFYAMWASAYRQMVPLESPTRSAAS